MKIKIFIPLCVMCTLLLVACARPDSSTNREATNSTATKATPTPPATAVLTTTEKIGIAECDDFLTAYDACVTTKVPEVARAQYKSTLDQWRTSWKKMADNLDTRASLAAACKQSAEQAKASMTAFNCGF